MIPNRPPAALLKAFVGTLDMVLPWWPEGLLPKALARDGCEHLIRG
jgi:hypothetical protein